MLQPICGRACTRFTRVYLSRPSGQRRGDREKQIHDRWQNLREIIQCWCSCVQGKRRKETKGKISESIKQNDTDTKTNRPFACIGIKLPIKQRGTLSLASSFYDLTRFILFVDSDRSTGWWLTWSPFFSVWSVIALISPHNSSTVFGMRLEKRPEFNCRATPTV